MAISSSNPGSRGCHASFLTALALDAPFSAVKNLGKNVPILAAASSSAIETAGTFTAAAMASASWRLVMLVEFVALKMSPVLLFLVLCMCLSVSESVGLNGTETTIQP